MEVRSAYQTRQNSASIVNQETDSIMDAARVMQSLISLSERAANVARVIRSQSDLFGSLIQGEWVVDRSPCFCHVI